MTHTRFISMRSFFLHDTDGSDNTPKSVHPPNHLKLSCSNRLGSSQQLFLKHPLILLKDFNIHVEHPYNNSVNYKIVHISETFFMISFKKSYAKL